VFLVLKWCGVAYLAYIGIRTFFSQQNSFAAEDAAEGRSKSRRSLYLQGFLVGGSNPKALLFFTAFFPQFINPQAAQLPQFLLLGATFVCFELFLADVLCPLRFADCAMAAHAGPRAHVQSLVGRGIPRRQRGAGQRPPGLSGSNTSLLKKII